MADNQSTPPHLVSVSPPDGDTDADAESTDAPAERGGRGALFWIVLAVALFAVVGHAYQGKRVAVLTEVNASLTSELYAARAALGAYTERFSAVRDTVAGLNAQIDALNALVAEDPGAAAAPGEAAAADPAAAPAADADR